MNDVERQHVRRALQLEGVECVHAIEAFRTPEQLHQFALNNNPNDGVLSMLAVVRHPNCDAGTATYVYWQFSTLLFEPESRELQQRKAAEWNASAVLDTIEQRFLKGSFTAAEIYCDPQADWQLNVIQRRNLIGAGVNPERLNPIGFRRVEREWLLQGSLIMACTANSV